jgi:hypothetical protein
MRTRRTSIAPAAHPGNSRLGKRLAPEIYVASEASATPLRNYAPQSNFLVSPRVALASAKTVDQTFDTALAATLEPALDSTNTDAIQP